MVYVLRHRDGSWEEVAGSASAGGVSNTSFEAASPAAASTRSLLCIAWAERKQVQDELVMRCTKPSAKASAGYPFRPGLLTPARAEPPDRGRGPGAEEQGTRS
jgi:hypothetical protein